MVYLLGLKHFSWKKYQKLQVLYVLLFNQFFGSCFIQKWNSLHSVTTNMSFVTIQPVRNGLVCAEVLKARSLNHNKLVHDSMVYKSSCQE